MSDVPTATKIAALEEQVRQLTVELEAMTEQAEQRRNRAKEAEHALANASKWIDGQDVLSDFPNATAMRQALEASKEREEAYRKDLVKLSVEHSTQTMDLCEAKQALDRERERANRLDKDRSHMTLRFNEETLAHFNTLNELSRERERCFVLEREVLKWRYAEYISRAIENAAYLDTERHELNAARTETDTRHALDAAKFVGGGQ